MIPARKPSLAAKLQMPNQPLREDNPDLVASYTDNQRSGQASHPRNKQRRSERKGERGLTPKQNPLLRSPPTLRIRTLRLPPDDPLWLLEWNTQALRTHTRRLLVLWRIVRILFPRRQLLDLVLALFRQAMGDQTDVLRVQRRDKVLPLRHVHGV